jgi:hypothetical protein
MFQNIYLERVRAVSPNTAAALDKFRRGKHFEMSEEEEIEVERLMLDGINLVDKIQKVEAICHEYEKSLPPVIDEVNDSLRCFRSKFIPMWCV